MTTLNTLFVKYPVLARNAHSVVPSRARIAGYVPNSTMPGHFAGHFMVSPSCSILSTPAGNLGKEVHAVTQRAQKGWLRKDRNGKDYHATLAKIPEELSTQRPQRKMR